MGLNIEGTDGEIIQSGDNRMNVSSREAKRFYYASRDKGQAFALVSGDFIPITTINIETGLLHIKNTSTTKNLYIENVRTCGTQIQKWKLYNNSTGGTLISGAVAGGSTNLNLTSSNEADADVYKGADLVTVTGGNMIEHWVNQIGHSVEIFNGALILGVNDSIQLTVELAVAGDVCARVIGYYE